jgi:hypothetical protein
MEGKTSSIVDLAVISLSSITAMPASPANLTVGFTQQFVATGTYSDGSTADVSSKVTWASANTATATIKLYRFSHWRSGWC